MSPDHNDPSGGCETSRPGISSRRHFIRGLTAAGLSTALSQPLARAIPDDLTTVSIFHTTDIHGHILPTTNYEGVDDLGGLARCATQIRKWRKENARSLLLDIGDLYQGTLVGLRTRGRVMMEILNKLNYDAWILGNHEFDWGIDVVEEIIGQARMPVLVANSRLGGKKPGAYPDKQHPYAKVAPWILKEVGGFKIGIVGVITPGLPYWTHKSMLTGFEATSPVTAVRAAVKQLRANGAECIVCAGHMGWKWKDDFANQVDTLTEQVEGIDAYIAGHTHQDIPAKSVNKVYYTQASYYGITCGRLDLTFSESTRALVDRRGFAMLMDRRLDLDPVVIETASKDLEEVKKEKRRKIGTFATALSHEAVPGKPSQIERLIGASIKAALEEKSVQVDAVVHGLFDDENPIAKGAFTVEDAWKVIPYENLLVTAELTPAEIVTMLDEMYNTRYNNRNILGMRAAVSEREDTKYPEFDVKRVTWKNGSPLDADQRYCIALNSYDAQSGGQRFLKLFEILKKPQAKTTLHEIMTRDALMAFISTSGTVTRDLLF